MSIAIIIIIIIVGVVIYLITQKYGTNLLNIMPKIKTTEIPKVKLPTDSTFNEMSDVKEKLNASGLGTVI